MKSCPTCRALYPDNFTVCPKDAAPLRLATDLTAGAVLRGKYEILEKLGEGGMGVVYKARHVHFDEVCALKLVTGHLGDDADFLQRFRAEALLMRRLDHPHAVRVHDFDETEDGRPFMVMEYVEGTSLHKLLAETGALDTLRAIRLAMQVCEALGAAHRLGIIHRDIKPANILVAPGPDSGDFVKVLDFGVAKVKESSQLRVGASLTRTGFIVGTPDYMSPEQAQGARGDQLDGRTDIYSLGVVLYEMLTGRLPFRADTPVMMLMAHIQKQPPDPRTIRAEIPGPLARVILYALEKSPGLRFASAEAMYDSLKDILEIQQIGLGTVRVMPLRAEPASEPPRAEPHPSQPATAAPVAQTEVITPPPRPAPSPRGTEPEPVEEVAEESPAPRPAAPAHRPEPRTVPQPAPRPAPRVPTLPPLQSYPPAAQPATSKALYVGGAAVLLVMIAVGGYLLWNRTTQPVTTLPASSVPSTSNPQQAAPHVPPAKAESTPAREPAAPAQPKEEAGKDAASRPSPPAASPEKGKPGTVRAPNPHMKEVQRLRTLANAALDAGRYEEAIRNFQAVLQLEPGHAAARKGLDRARRAKAAEEVILKKP